MTVRLKRQKVQTSQDTLTDGRLPGRPWPPFFLAWHPDSVDFADGMWLPHISQIATVAGVNGCHGKSHRDGTVTLNSTLMRADMRDQGWRELDPGIMLLVTDPDTGEIVETSGWLESVEGKRGPFYCTPWDAPEVRGVGQKARAEKGKWDHAGYNAWRKWLLDTGVVPALNVAVLDDKVRVQDRRARRRIADAHDGAPHVQAKVEAEHQRAADMRGAISGDDATTPVKRSARRKANPEVTSGE